MLFRREYKVWIYNERHEMKNKEQEIEVKLLKIDCHCVVLSIDQQKILAS
jgi:hypothetical protein